MTLGRARVLKATEHAAKPLAVDSATRPDPRTPPARVPRRVDKVTVDAHERAQNLLTSARTEAERILAESRRQAAEIALRAEAEGRANGAAALAAQAIALRSRELCEAERRLDELVDLARALAERVLGEELGLAPERVVALARQALAEARGARHITIEAHPDDVVMLQATVATSSVEADAVKLLANPNRAPGNLKIVTEVGVLDASLAPQLERLALKLRETLG